MPFSFKRPVYRVILERMREPRRHIQVLAGPRQVGKSTLARQVVEVAGIPAHIASADEPAFRDNVWIARQWDVARSEASRSGSALLVLDEIHKVQGWDETVKRLYDEDTVAERSVKVLLLGSSPLLVQRGLGTLAGRFELIRVGHWSFTEMRDAFGFDLDQYLFYGGYPGAVAYTGDAKRWRSFVVDSLIETTISRDVLLLTRIDKPALLRQLFRLACEYSGQIVAYQKLLGQLQDAGNASTLAHYVELLAGAGMIAALPKYSGSRLRQRASSPKLLALNNALITATLGLEPSAVKDERWRGRLVESAVGAHLLRSGEVWYWRERNQEVDFVVRFGRSVVALEVKSGDRQERLRGLAAFAAQFRGVRTFLVGSDGVPIEEFLSSEPARWLAV